MQSCLPCTAAGILCFMFYFQYVCVCVSHSTQIALSRLRPHHNTKQFAHVCPMAVRSLAPHSQMYAQFHKHNQCTEWRHRYSARLGGKKNSLFFSYGKAVNGPHHTKRPHVYTHRQTRAHTTRCSPTHFTPT